MEKRSEYPSFKSAGNSKPPRAKIVTPEAPVKAVKRAQSRRVIIVRPPGSQPRKIRENWSIRCGALLSERRIPAKIKSGRETSRGVSANRDISIITTEISISTE